MDWFKGKKTYILSGLMILIAIVKLASGDMTVTMFLNSPELLQILAGLGLSSLRSGVAKSGPSN